MWHYRRRLLRTNIRHREQLINKLTADLGPCKKYNVHGGSSPSNVHRPAPRQQADRRPQKVAYCVRSTSVAHSHVTPTRHPAQSSRAKQRRVLLDHYCRKKPSRPRVVTATGLCLRYTPFPSHNLHLPVCFTSLQIHVRIDAIDSFSAYLDLTTPQAQWQQHFPSSPAWLRSCAVRFGVTHYQSAADQVYTFIETGAVGVHGN